MRQFKLFLTLLTLMCFGVGQMWGASPATLSFTAKCNGSGTDSDGNSWTITSDATESNFDNDKGIHYGTNNAAVTNIVLTSASFGNDKTITQVVVEASGNNSPSLSVTVGGVAFGTTKTGITTSNTSYTFEPTVAQSANEYKGVVVVTLAKSSSAKKAIYVKSVSVSYEEDGGGGSSQTTYTITPASNNTSYGTVELSGTTITATPKSGYQVVAGDDGYTVTNGTATVTNNGDNTFSVVPSSDCTVRINFEAIPTYTVTLKDDNSTLTQTSGGANVELPSRGDCTSKGYTFAGWTKSWTSTITEATTTAPTIIPAGSYTPEGDENLYPVYTKTEDGSNTGAEIGTTMWAENFSGFAKDDYPDGSISNSHTGTTVYNNGSVTYTVTAGTDSRPKIFDDGGSGTDGNNMLIYKKNGYFTIEGIAVGGASTLTLSFTKGGSGALAVSGSDNITVSGSTTGSTITVNSGTTFDLKFQNTNNSNNLRLDDISVVVATTNNNSTTYYLSDPNCCTLHDVNIASGLTNGSVSADITSACSGISITLTIEPSTGYELDALTVGGSNVTSSVSNNTYSFDMPNNDIAVSATFKAKKHYVIFNKNAGDNPEETSTQEYTFAADAVNLKSIETIGWTREDYSFNGWNTQANGLGTPYSNGASFTLNVDADVDLYAQWMENSSHGVTYNGDNHITSYSTKPNKIAEDAEELTVEFTLETGYEVTAVEATINGVDVDENNITYDQTMVYIVSDGFAGDVVITFTIEEIIYTVTFDKGSGVCETSTLDQASYNANIKLPAATASEACVEEGWTFAGWTTAKVASETTTAPETIFAAESNYQPTSDITLYAVYQRSDGNTFDGSAGGNFYIYAVVGEAKYYANGTGSKIESTTDIAQATSYTFAKVSDGVFTIKTGNNYIAYKSNTDLEASETAYNWTLEGGTHGTWRVNSGTSGRALVYRAGTTDKYGGYSTSNINGTEYFDVEIGGATTIYYHSTPSCAERYTITVDGEITNGSVAIAPNVAKAIAGTALKLTATAVENESRFKQWNVTGLSLSDVQKTTNPLDIEMPESNLTVSATFDALYEIKKDEQNGTITLGATYAAAGDEVTISASANDQYKNPVLTVFETATPANVIAVSDGKFTMPACGVTARVVCEPALASLDAPVLGDATNVTYQGVTLNWTGVTGNEGYVLTIQQGGEDVEGFVDVAIAKNATSYAIASGLAAKTDYTYSIYTKGDGENTLLVNTPANGAFSTVDYPAATLMLSEVGADAYNWGTDLKLNSVIALPASLQQSDGCTDKVLVGWSSETITEPGSKPQENYWEAGADYTMLSTEVTLYAVYATVSGNAGGTWVINTTNFDKPGSGSGYTAYNGDHTLSDITYNSSDVMLQSGKIQFKSGSGVIYNKTAFGTDIASIEIDGISSNVTVYEGEEEISTGGTSVTLTDGVYPFSAGKRYFRIKMGNETGKATSITVNLASSVTYTGYSTSCTAATIDHYELGGEYQTVFNVNEDFNHDGLIVYAAYDEEGEDKINITASCSFSTPDMSTTGEKTIEITYKNEVVKSYTITIYKQANSPASFTELSGSMNPSDITYAFDKGNAGNDPYITTSGAVRLYQASTGNYGGFVTLKAAKGFKINQVVVTTTNSFATTVAYSVDDNANLLASADVAKSGSYSTPNNLNVEKVNIVNLGTDNSGRLEIASIKVYYRGEALAVHHYVLGGEYETEFEVGSTFSYEGLTVTAAYDADATITEPINDFTVVADLSTTGNKKAEVKIGNEKIAEYDITVTEVKSDAELAYNPTTVSLMVGETLEGAELQYAEGFDGLDAITYASSNENLATVAADGVVSLVAYASGEATITATFPGNDSYRKGSASYTITVSADAIEIPTELPDFANGSWIKVTDANSIHAGQYLMIAAANQNYALAPKKNSDNNRAAQAVQKVVAGADEVLVYENEPAVLFVQNGLVGGQYGLYNINVVAGENNGYLKAATSSGSNHMTISTLLDLDVYTSWSIAISEGVASIVASGSQHNNDMRYNSGSTLFSCYASTASQQPLAIFRFVENKYLVRYVAEHVTPAPANVLVNSGTTVTLPEDEPEYTGYDFNGWSVNGTNYEAGSSFSITENTTIIAKWRKIIPENQSVDASTLPDNADVVVPDGSTLVIDNAAANKPLGDVTVQSGAMVIVNNEMSADSIVVEDGGKVTLNDAVSADVFHISTCLGQNATSGQVAANKTGGVYNTLHADVMYMDVQLLSASEYTEMTTGVDPQTYSAYWYAISAPFDVNIADGFYTTDDMHLVNNQHIQVWIFDPAKYATGGRAWSRCSTKMEANKAHLIGFNPTALGGEGNVPTVIRLKFENVTIGVPTTTLIMEQTGSTYNWNGVANPNMHYVNVANDGQMYDNTSHNFTTYESGHDVVVSSPIFFNSAAVGSSITINPSATLSAPARVEENRYSFRVRILKQGARFYDNQMIVRASESALPTFEQGKDMETLNEACNGSAILWTNAYGKRLAIEEAPLQNNQAIYDLSIMTPAAGTYVLRQANEVEGATLYVTYNGAIVWNLSLGDYEIDLARGTTTGYGLLLVAQPNQMPTGVDTSEGVGGDAVQKILLNGQLYILRDGKMFDAVGKEVK